MVSATLLATAQEGGKVKYTVSGEKVTYTRTLTPVPAGTMVVKKPPVAGNTAKKRSAPPEHSARDSRGTNSSETPAWKRAQEENARRLSSLEYGQSNIQLDVTDLKRSQVKTEVRLDNIEQKIDMLGNNLSNAQALQRKAEERSQSSQTQTTFDFEREKRNRRTFRAGVIGVVLVGIAGGIIYSVVRNSNNNNQPYQPPTPTPTPNTNGSPAGVPVIY